MTRVSSAPCNLRTEYVAADHDLVWIVPEKTSFEEAAAIGGIAAETAAQARPSLTEPSVFADLRTQAFYIRFDLNDPTSPVTSAEPVLVWAGSTSGTSVELFASWPSLMYAAVSRSICVSCSPSSHGRRPSLTSLTAYNSPTKPAIKSSPPPRPRTFPSSSLSAPTPPSTTRTPRRPKRSRQPIPISRSLSNAYVRSTETGS